jgi:glycosyltransferase involved in cell wall biosynthesis
LTNARTNPLFLSNFNYTFVLNILYLSYDGLTDPLGQSQVLPYLAGLSRQGYHITILSAEKKQAFQKRKSLISGQVEAAGISWYPLLYTKYPPVFSTLLDLRKMERLAEKLHHQKPFDLVHCRSYVTALIGEKLKDRYGIGFIFDMRGFWADERVEGGLWNLKNPVYRHIYQFFKKKERDFLLKANYTISLTYAAADEIHQWPGMEAIPIQVIPCCVDTELFDRERVKLPQLEKLWSELNILPEEFVISYLGSLGTWYLIEDMLRFFQVLEKRYPDSKFLFITPDSPKLVLEPATRLGIAERKFIFRKAERKEVPLLLKISLFSLFFVRPSFSKKASSPTKMGEILSMGIPVVCNGGIGDIDYLYREYPFGYKVERLEEETFKRIVYSIEDLLALPSSQLRKAALEYFDLQKGVESYVEVYRKVLTSGS